MSASAGDPSMDVVVVSALPGRIRLRSAQAPAKGRSLRRLAEALEERPEVIEVRLNRHADSLVIRVDPAASDLRRLAPLLAGLGVRVRPAPLPGDARSGPGRGARAAGGVGGRLAGTDRRLIIPLALAALSVRQAVRGAPGLREAPWYVLAWYAFDTFRAFAPARAGRTVNGSGRATTEGG